ncbi:hypothetical protein MGU_11100 [Metarhizium guizhouense ARSEF 977]|uniref:Uncharacterized protein n=1 Tax=Metarhizium guizhouense (strain ARSEF 977) TaxID=1276136 RepID=A0A0B4GPB0_METGA|nr:hypothetical protein MGU_11100 [Metarhizium guizhouense ARSEF 977]
MDAEEVCKLVTEVEILEMSQDARNGILATLEEVVLKLKAREALSDALNCTLKGFVGFSDAALNRLTMVIRAIYARATNQDSKTTVRAKSLWQLPPVEFIICGLSQTENQMARMNKATFSAVIRLAESAAPKVRPIIMANGDVEHAVRKARVQDFITSKTLESPN